MKKRMTDSFKRELNRRGFLKGLAIAAQKPQELLVKFS